MRAGADGKYPYAGVVDCFQKVSFFPFFINNVKSIAREGVTGLWTGLPTFYFRVAPHAMIVKKNINKILTFLDFIDSRFPSHHNFQL